MIQGEEKKIPFTDMENKKVFKAEKVLCRYCTLKPEEAFILSLQKYLHSKAFQVLIFHKL